LYAALLELEFGQ